MAVTSYDALIKDAGAQDGGPPASLVPCGKLQLRVPGMSGLPVGQGAQALVAVEITRLPDKRSTLPAIDHHQQRNDIALKLMHCADSESIQVWVEMRQMSVEWSAMVNVDYTRLLTWAVGTLHRPKACPLAGAP